MKKLLTIAMMAVMSVTVANAQGLFGKLKEKAVEKAKSAIENKKNKNAQEEVTVEEDETETAPVQDKKKKVKAQTAKSDFVPGTVVLFEDNLDGEQMGEFPSKWDLLENNAEVAEIDGKMAIRFEHGADTDITPLVEEGSRQYLPEVFTLEFDYFVTGEDGKDSHYRLLLEQEEEEWDKQSTIWFNHDRIGWRVAKPNTDDKLDGETALDAIHELDGWNHFALSFNKRALKVYVNGQRVINIPNAVAPDWFHVRTEFWEDHVDYITNIRLAKGGVELYDRNVQNMTAIAKAVTETGKFVTNNILFETGKAVLMPESMEEIKKVAQYMLITPGVRFEVQGHTDNQGSDKVNDPLSQQRAQAVVDALVALGCDEFSLRAVGKGSHEPVADNSTEAGRAQNRRVEFIKK